VWGGDETFHLAKKTQREIGASLAARRGWRKSLRRASAGLVFGKKIASDDRETQGNMSK
jgi:hypothetical protein